MKLKSAFLTPKEIDAAINAENSHLLVIGGAVDPYNKLVKLIYGNFNIVEVPFFMIKPNATAKPNFRDFEITDSGLSVRFGNYEAASDSLIPPIVVPEPQSVSSEIGNVVGISTISDIVHFYKFYG